MWRPTGFMPATGTTNTGVRFVVQALVQMGALAMDVEFGVSELLRCRFCQEIERCFPGSQLSNILLYSSYPTLAKRDLLQCPPVVKAKSFDVSSLQQWLKKHGGQMEVLHLNLYSETALTVLPCPVLRDLQLSVLDLTDGHLAIGSGVWSDIAAATKLTSVSLSWCGTPFQQEAVSALTALPHLQQLSWCSLRWCNWRTGLSDVSALLQHQKQLTRLQLHGVTAEALQHLGSFSKLQHLSIGRAALMAPFDPTMGRQEWDEGSLPDLQMLTALTSLEWDCSEDLPGSIYQLTALQQLTVGAASTTAIDGLQVMFSLTCLCVLKLKGHHEASGPWQLPALQHLSLTSRVYDGVLNMALLARCTQLRQISLQCLDLAGSVGLLGSSSNLQGLSMFNCRPHRAASWQQVFHGSAQLPQLTTLRLEEVSDLYSWTPWNRIVVQPTRLTSVAACCTGLKELRLANAAGTHVLAQLAHLTSLDLFALHQRQCSSLVQLTGLRQLRIFNIAHLSVAELRELAALQQLTSLSLGGLWLGRLDELVKSRMTDTLPGCKPSSCEHALVNKAPSGSPSDVPARLLAACCIEPDADEHDSSSSAAPRDELRTYALNKYYALCGKCAPPEALQRTPHVSELYTMLLF